MENEFKKEMTKKEEIDQINSRDFNERYVDWIGTAEKLIEIYEARVRNNMLSEKAFVYDWSYFIGESEKLMASAEKIGKSEKTENMREKIEKLSSLINEAADIYARAIKEGQMKSIHELIEVSKAFVNFGNQEKALEFQMLAEEFSEIERKKSLDSLRSGFNSRL